MKNFEWFETLSELNKLEKVSFKNPKAGSRYDGYFNWVEVLFDLNKIKLKDSNVIGINIIPYTITKKDVMDAICQTSPDNKYPKNVDWDKSTGNFHKLPDGTFQFVLIHKDSKHHHGPLWKESTSSKMLIPEDEKWKWKVDGRNQYCLNENYFRPAIGIGVKPDKVIEELVKLIKELEK